MKRATAIVVMAAASVAFMAPALFRGRTAGSTDLLLTYSPYREYIASEVRPGNPLQSDLVQQMSFLAEFWSAAKEGRLQRWEPDVGGGIPLFTAMYNQLLPPWFLAFLVVPLALGTTIGLTLALFVAQLGVYGLARRLGSSVYAATFAAVAYAFSGAVTSMLLRIHGAFLFPLLLYAIHGAITEPARRGRYLALTSVVMLFVWSSGFPFAGVAITYVTAAWVLYLAVANSHRVAALRSRLAEIVRLGAPAGAALAAGTMIASIQLLPSMEFLSKTGFLERRFSNHLDGAMLSSAVSGRFFGAFQDDDWWWPVLGGSNPFEASLTIGLVALGLVAVVIAGVRGRVDAAGERAITRFLLPVGLIVFAATYLGGIALDAVHVLPYTVNNPIGRARFMTSLAIALVAAIGLDRILDRSREARRPPPLLRLQLLALLATVATGTFFGFRRASRVEELGNVVQDLAVPVGALLLATLAVGLLRNRRTGAAAIVVIAAAAELQWGAWGFMPASPRDAFYPPSRGYEAIAADVGPGGSYRFLARQRNTPRFDTPAFLDLKDARTAFPRIERYQDLWVALDPEVFRVNRYNPTFELLDPASPVLDALSVRYLLEPLHRNALEIGGAGGVERRRPVPLPASFRVTVPARGVRQLIVPLRPARSDCTTGWVELRAAGVTSRRLLYETAGVSARFTLPDVGRPFERLQVGLTSTSCPVVLDAGRIEVKQRSRDSVLRVASLEGWVVYERAAPIPRATLAAATVEIGHPAERIRYIAGRSAKGAVTVEDGFGSRRYAGGTAELVLDDPDVVRVRTTSNGPGFLVLRDVDAPGWSATVNGRPADIVTADHAFRGVAVPDGTALVEFRYDPPAYRRGILLAIAGVLLTIGLAAGPSLVRSMTRRRAADTVGNQARTDDDR